MKNQSAAAPQTAAKPVLVLPMSGIDTTAPLPVRTALRMLFMTSIKHCETFASLEDQATYFTEIQEWAARNLTNFEGIAAGANPSPIAKEAEAAK